MKKITVHLHHYYFFLSFVYQQLKQTNAILFTVRTYVEQANTLIDDELLGLEKVYSNLDFYSNHLGVLLLILYKELLRDS